MFCITTHLIITSIHLLTTNLTHQIYHSNKSYIFQNEVLLRHLCSLRRRHGCSRCGRHLRPGHLHLCPESLDGSGGMGGLRRGRRMGGKLRCFLGFLTWSGFLFQGQTANTGPVFSGVATARPTPSVSSSRSTAARTVSPTKVPVEYGMGHLSAAAEHIRGHMSEFLGAWVLLLTVITWKGVNLTINLDFEIYTCLKRLKRTYKPSLFQICLAISGHFTLSLLATGNCLLAAVIP